MNIEPLNEESIKFNSCKFRSEESVKNTIKRCSCQGGDYEIDAFTCYEREIFQVTPDICKDCPVYQSK